MRLIDFDRDGEPCGVFTKTIDLLGDGSIRLIFTPGHTVGHMSVLLRLAGGHRVLVVGDAAYTLRNIREGILPMLTANDEACLRSMREIKAFADEPEASWCPRTTPARGTSCATSPIPPSERYRPRSREPGDALTAVLPSA